MFWFAYFEHLIFGSYNEQVFCAYTKGTISPLYQFSVLYTISAIYFSKRDLQVEVGNNPHAKHVFAHVTSSSSLQIIEQVHIWFSPS